MNHPNSPDYATCIINGRIMKYHAACTEKFVRYHTADIFHFLGKGYVHRVGGVMQGGLVRLHFFRLNKNRPRWAA